MPRSIASASSRATIIGRVTANRGLTEKPPGTQRSLAMIASYSSTHSRASSGSMNENDSAPIPFSAARRIVSRREHATHSGGGGFFVRVGAPVGGGELSGGPAPPLDGPPPPLPAGAARGPLPPP